MPYIGTSPSNGVRRVHTYTATASQTTFSGASSEGITLSYVDANYLDVFQNGVLLGSADYTSTSGTSVVLAQGASADDLIVIVVYDVFSVADTVSKTNGGTFDSAVTVSGAFTSQGIDDNADAVALTINSSEQVGIGTSSPTNKLHLNESTSGGNYLQVTNSTTGATSSDGLIVGLGASEDAYVWQYENQALVFATNNTERFRLDNAGRLFVNTTTVRNSGLINIDFSASSQGAFGINDTASANGGVFIGFLSGGTFRGSITNNNNTAVAYNTTSDHRLKENVTADWDATTRLKQLNPVRFNFIADADRTVDGFLAHEVQSVVPEAITGTHNEVDDDGNPVYQGIDQSKLVPLLVKTIQELEARITALENAE